MRERRACGDKPAVAQNALRDIVDGGAIDEQLRIVDDVLTRTVKTFSLKRNSNRSALPHKVVLFVNIQKQTGRVGRERIIDVLLAFHLALFQQILVVLSTKVAHHCFVEMSLLFVNANTQLIGCFFLCESALQRMICTPLCRSVLCRALIDCTTLQVRYRAHGVIHGC